MKFLYNDGGRKKAGYVGNTNDCTVRAIVIATERDYQEVYNALFDLNRQNNKDPRKCSPRGGNTNMKTIKAYLKTLGWEWTATMGIGTGCQFHMRADELPSGRIIARVSKHLAAVVDGVLHDTYDCTRKGRRCVYGYWKKATEEN